MENCLFKSLEYMRSFFNLYIITISSFAIMELIGYINNKYYNQDSKISFLNNTIYSDYFSLIYGILFLVFSFILFLMFLQLNTIISQIPIEKDISTKLFETLKYFPWISSPFHINFSGLIFFIFLISGGIIYTLSLSLSHLFKTPPVGKEFLFKGIGFFDLTVFIITLLLMVKIGKVVSEIRKIIN